MSDTQTIVVALLVWSLLLAAIYITRKLLRDETRWRCWRVGFFFEREAHERDAQEYEDADVAEDDAPQMRRLYPSDE